MSVSMFRWERHHGVWMAYIYTGDTKKDILEVMKTPKGEEDRFGGAVEVPDSMTIDEAKAKYPRAPEPV